MNGGTTLRFSAAALALITLASIPTMATATPGRPAQAAPAKSGPLSPRLAVLAGEADAPTQRRAPSPDEIDGLHADAGGRLYVDVRVAGPGALAQADALPGIAVEATTPDGAAATLAVPEAQLGALADVAGVLAADEVPEPQIDRSHRAAQGAPRSRPPPPAPAGPPSRRLRPDEGADRPIDVRRRRHRHQDRHHLRLLRRRQPRGVQPGQGG
ncbi:hypothetical protein ACE2AJ_01120 [Aquihabitans daechungensis]|uniref:hypothetical protein n=1 Tax=Aquihabitans daechungensis TaxID=1052257 RepID=UPI003B9E85B6